MRPVGGIAIWARVADSIDVERWAAAAADNGVHLRTGKTFAFDGRMYPFVRFGFAALDMHEARDALERLAVAAKVAARSSSHARRRVQV